uniref:Uncharacterized protein n=1 Tax=Amazona collaria TaxID=241587 RepID=A0A8B9F660_9PSIT
MASHSANKEPLDPVRLNQLLCERVRKELKYQRLHTEYSVNPLQAGEAAHGRSQGHEELASGPEGKTSRAPKGADGRLATG